MNRVKIPDWAFEVAYALCKARRFRYRHQFKIPKIEQAVRDDPQLQRDVEGVVGYIGDICACVFLGVDPKNQLRKMVVDTDLLSHRDAYDLAFRGWRIDVKVEFYPEDKFQRIMDRTIDVTETYGCHLVNATQFEENAETVDAYVFSTLDQLDPRKAAYWYPVGWIMKELVPVICPQPRKSTPAGAPLWDPAYVIPNDILEPMEALRSIDQKPGEQPDGVDELPEDERRRWGRDLDALFRRLGL